MTKHRETCCQRILSALRNAGDGWVTRDQLYRASRSHRYSARILELRKAGHNIITEVVQRGGHNWSYYRLAR